MVTKGKGREKGKTQELGIKTHTRLHKKQVTNEDLLCRTGNYTQYLVITCNGRKC